jgi:hypothetical protein
VSYVDQRFCVQQLLRNQGSRASHPSRDWRPFWSYADENLPARKVDPSKGRDFAGNGRAQPLRLGVAFAAGAACFSAASSSAGAGCGSSGGASGRGSGAATGSVAFSAAGGSAGAGSFSGSGSARASAAGGAAAGSGGAARRGSGGGGGEAGGDLLGRVITHPQPFRPGAPFRPRW